MLFEGSTSPGAIASSPRHPGAGAVGGARRHAWPGGWGRGGVRVEGLCRLIFELKGYPKP